MLSAWIINVVAQNASYSVHDHATDLQNRHVRFLALVSLPHDGAHPLQARVGAVQPGNMTLQEGCSSNRATPFCG